MRLTIYLQTKIMKNFTNDLLRNINEGKYHVGTFDTTYGNYYTFDSEMLLDEEINIIYYHDGKSEVRVYLNRSLVLEYSTLQDAIDNLDMINDVFTS